MRNLFWYILLPTYGYQVQVPQVPQGHTLGHSQNTQPNNQQNSYYVPQQGSSGYAPVPPPRPPPPPRGPPQRRRPQQQKQGHDDDHDHNSDYRWEISGCHKPVISAQVGFRQFLVSDSFPNINPAEMFCVWRMKAPMGMIIKLTWRNFHIDNCKVSNLRIFDGFGPVNTPSPHTYCGLKKPPSYHSQDRMVTMVLNNAATGSPLGVQLMIGFEAVVDPMASVMPNSMSMPVLPPGLGLGGISSSSRPSSGAGKSSGTRLVPIGKYSFKREEITEPVETENTENDTFDETPDDETTGGLLESVPKEKLTLYIGAGIGGLLVFIFIVSKIHTHSRTDDENKETE